MLLASIFVVAIGLAIFMIYPMLSPEDEEKATLPVDVTPASDLKRRRIVVYENLQDLEFEYQANKIAQKDYESLRDSYKAEAARLMVASQDLDRGTAEDRFIEKEVAARRARFKSQIVETYECKTCGFNNPIPVKFCGNCGSPISKAPAGER
ncbi:MAG TPA: zinc ribbon domain-containing protein [Terriglobia bacterium]|nr:zinc ribbon domain-containing protein [Terriglobia bacterium]